MSPQQVTTKSQVSSLWIASRSAISIYAQSKASIPIQGLMYCACSVHAYYMSVMLVLRLVRQYNDTGHWQYRSKGSAYSLCSK